MGVELDTATLLESLLCARIRIRPLAILVSGALKIPINSFLCQLGCLVSIAGMFRVFVYTIIACLPDFYGNFCLNIVFLSTVYETPVIDVELSYPQT